MLAMYNRRLTWHCMAVLCLDTCVLAGVFGGTKRCR